MKNGFFKYYKAYKWSNVFAMIRNGKKEPLSCADQFEDKLVVITGATSGIGYHTARKYAEQGARLLCINRNLDKSEALCRELREEFSITCDYLLADLSLREDWFRLADELNRLETPIAVLIHNAGVYLTSRETTTDGFEKVLAVHYLSSFVLNFLLSEKLKSQEHARIIMVGSEGHRFAAWGLDLDDLNWARRRYSGLKSYGSAKTAQLLAMLVFNDHFRGSGVRINTMHPGAVKTETGQDNGPVYKWFKRNFFDRTLKSARMSAEALYYLGVSKDIQNVSGKFFNLTTEEEPAPPAVDMEVASELWKRTLAMTGLDKKME